MKQYFVTIHVCKALVPVPVHAASPEAAKEAARVLFQQPKAWIASVIEANPEGANVNV